jgi:hypothetical protein
VALKNLLLYCMIAFFVLTTTLFIVMFIAESAKSADLSDELAGTKLRLQDTQSDLADATSTIETKNREISLRQSDIANLTLELDSKNHEIVSLSVELNRTEAELLEAKSSLEMTETEIAEIRDETIAMDERINQSIQWFTTNSVLASTFKGDRFISKVENGCVSHDTINLACISYQMSDELGFAYKNDPTGDKLYSLEEIISRRGGDCEDYALFFKATLNRLNESGKDLEAWESGVGRYLVYEDWSTYTRWFRDDAQAVSLGDAGSLKPYVACFYFDTYGPAMIGHCIIMLSGKDIRTPADITNSGLSDAVFFEPQDGKYVGKMGGVLIACEDGQAGCDGELYRVAFIISDNDLFEFSDDRWNYYEGYQDRTEALLAKLDTIRRG